MRNALQDQLLKAGLVNDKQVKKATLEKRKEERHNQGVKPAISEEEIRLQQQRAQAEKVERDRQLNIQRKEAAEQKALAAQIKQLVETHRCDKGEDEVAYNFIDANKVKTLRVSEKVRDQICRGILAVIKLTDHYELVPTEIAEKIRLRNPAFIMVDNALQQDLQTQKTEDSYAKYQVPDDLMW